MLRSIRSKFFRTEYFLNSLILLASSFIGLILVEVTYRAYLHNDIGNEVRRLLGTGGTAIYDPDVGYRYLPNRSYSQATPYKKSFQINEFGHVADVPYTKPKPGGQFRIGVLGDSYTAAIESEIRWTAVLMDKLNSSEQWSDLVKGQETLIINFGMSGIGTEQFDDVLEHNALPFDLDFLIVNFLREDIIRKWYERGIVLSKLGENIDPEAVPELLVERFNLFWADDIWRLRHSEVLALIFGNSPNFSRQYTSQAVISRFSKLFDLDRNYADPLTFNHADGAAAVPATLESFRFIKNQFPNALFLRHPAYNEYPPVIADYNVGTFFVAHKEAFEMLKPKIPDIEIFDMMPRMPNPETRQELDKYFNAPHDHHHNSLGNKIYGEAVADLMLKYCRSVSDSLTCRSK